MKKVKNALLLLFTGRQIFDEETYDELIKSLSDSDLSSAMHDTNSEIRVSAVCALGDRRGEYIDNILIAATKDRDDSVRYSAFYAIKDRSGEAIDDVLVSSIGDDDTRVLKTIVAGLRNRQGEKIEGALCWLATNNQEKQPWRQVRLDAVNALIGRPGKKIDEALLFAAEDPDRQVRGAARDVLMGRAGKKIEEALITLVQKENNGDYDQLDEGLEKMDDKTLVAKAKDNEKKKYGDNVVRDYAVYTLRKRGKIKLLMDEIVE